MKDCAEPYIVAAVLSSAVPHARALTDAVTKAGGEPLRILGPSLTKLAKALGESAPVAATPLETTPGTPAPATNRADVIKKFQPALKLTGNPANGRAIFTQLCVTCHKLGDTGNEIGPNLVSVGASPKVTKSNSRGGRGRCFLR